MRSLTTPLVRITSLLLLLTLLAPPLHAQYFGRNKVQWESFDFKVMHTQHFDIYYYEREKDVVPDVGRMAERWYYRLSRVFNHEFGRKPIVLYANAADFQQTTTTFEILGEGTGGFTDPLQNRVVLPLTGDYAENDHVLGHEMVHVFQFDIANSISNTRGATRRRFDVESMPLWLIEGMAEYFSKGRFDPLTAMWIRDASTRNKMPDLRKLSSDPRYFPYRYGQALLAYIGSRFGDDAVVNLFLASGSGGVQQAFPRALGVSDKELFAEWHSASKALYDPIVTARPIAPLGKPLIGSKSRGTLNIGPSYSPDGRWVAFLSSRELFSIDLYLADAKTGEVKEKLVSSDADPHFDALRFIDSAGAWSPDSKKLAFVVFENGDNRLAIIDVDSRRVESRTELPGGIDSLSNPAWSPDGHTIAFSGQTTGVTDLYTYDLSTNQIRQLTNDKYADLQPTWSPDGKTIAFVTDRGTETDFNRLHFDNLRIATIDVNSASVSLLPLFEIGQHINPQFSPDGRALYFIGNPEGIADVFRYNFADRSLARITKVPTGVSGIIEASPALTVSPRSGDLAFSVYENDSYDIYSMAPPAAPESVTAALGNSVPLAALLPPQRASANTANYTSYLERPDQGLLPASTTFRADEPSSGLHLTYLGPPTIGVGADRFGYGVGGSISAYFSDVLGYNNVGFTVQGGAGSSQSFSETLAAEVQYLNQKHRFNWGATASHIPEVSIGPTVVSQETVTIDGQQYLADVVEQERFVQTFDEISGLAAFPFGQTRRVEGSVGYERIGFKSEVERAVIIGDQVVEDRTTSLGNNESLNLVRGSAAFVGDSATFGFVSPIRGTRYRFEGSALTGDLKFQTALADWRKYFFFRPVTLAIRGLHYGRYGTDAESDRLSSLYVGQQTLVRGYNIDSFSLRECGQRPAGSNECPAFDRLVGSRIAVASMEVRVPLLGTKEFGLIPASAVPTELTFFADAGTAWSQGQHPKLKFEQNTDERVPVFSAGVSLRVLLSYIPLEFYYAHPFQRPEKNWVFGFNIAPGW